MKTKVRFTITATVDRMIDMENFKQAESIDECIEQESAELQERQAASEALQDADLIEVTAVKLLA